MLQTVVLLCGEGAPHLPPSPNFECFYFSKSTNEFAFTYSSSFALSPIRQLVHVFNVNTCMLGGHTPAANIRAHVKSIAPTEISERETLLCTLR